MVRAIRIRRVVGALCAVLALALADVADAQSTGRVRGTVLDSAGQPVAGATVVVEVPGNSMRRYETTTDDEGEYSQIGIPPGDYQITASKEGVGMHAVARTVRAGDVARVDLQLLPVSGPSEADVVQSQESQTAFNEAIAANDLGDLPTAIAKFREAAELSGGTCYACYYNMGSIMLKTEDAEGAEAAFKRAIEIKADYGEAYNALANLYNSQRRFDEAAEMSGKAAELSAATGGGDPTALFNQGVILWNAGNLAEAKAQFERTVAADPTHAEAHYWLGMANLNEGNMAEASAEFEKYLELDPGGQYAAQVEGVLSQLNP